MLYYGTLVWWLRANECTVKVVYSDSACSDKPDITTELIQLVWKPIYSRVKKVGYNNFACNDESGNSDQNLLDNTFFPPVITTIAQHCSRYEPESV